ncbi:chromate transporter, partial [Methylophaga sp.]|uniref:chromate transporter n=1 Tax=Methylophaga sp. TaxID=2024840 RepID=UPI003F69AC1D
MKHIGSVVEVFVAFLKLGLTSFGGPIAHIAYYRHVFIEQRKWLSEAQFAQLLALCQFLPGPASSQMGFSVGMLRAGWLGGIAAFVAFTLPSALLLFGFAKWLPYLSDSISNAAIHGLKLVALVVVAQAVWLMSKQLCPDWRTRIIAITALIFLLCFNSPFVQMFVVIAGAIAGMLFCHSHNLFSSDILNVRHSERTAWLLLAVFFVLLFSLPLLSEKNSLLAVVDAFYRAGALVFG